MPVASHFMYDWVNPVAAYLLATMGGLLGLGALRRSRTAGTRRRRTRWLFIAAVAIGSGVWLTHLVAMLGFDVPASPVRYDIVRTVASVVVAVVVIGIGVFICGTGSAQFGRIVVGGTFVGAGTVAMHYVGMTAVRVDGTISYQLVFVVLSVAAAVAVSVLALMLSVLVRRGPVLSGAAVLGVAACGMHYLAMAGVRVHLAADPGPVPGLDPILLVAPIVVVSNIGLVVLVMGALQTMSQEETAPTAYLNEISSTGPRRAVSLTAFAQTEFAPTSSRHGANRTA
jgi:NO-binding membrane sensor protein with MHYT domain